MAGAFPDDESWRIPWDIDGTKLFSITGGVATEVTDEVTKTILNNENVIDEVDRTVTWAWVFPSMRLLDRLVIYTDGGGTTQVEYSDNSTDGVDGTWFDAVELVNAVADVEPVYRTDQRRFTQDCKAIRLSSIGATDSGSGLSMVHIYGDFDFTVNNDSLILWHPNLDQRVPPGYFDYGNVVRGSSEDLTFRVRNLSSNLIAQDVSVFLDALTQATPGVAEQHLLSENAGLLFTSINNMGDLGPGVVSGMVTMRRNTSRTAELGLWAFRVRAIASNWVSSTG